MATNATNNTFGAQSIRGLKQEITTTTHAIIST